MPKQKPHKGTRKRMHVTARKKVIRKKSFAGHLMSGKSGRRRQRLRRRAALKGAFVQRVLRVLCAE
ncbi:MAG: 50S ribosomal protein L35 [Phycisphaerae bacterium]|nr:50S ribosomal protein L35 [Phycisphaerae bacterium]MCZ2399621.1 50S ribosomal protein L35 [Phycisphaerae bacterium]HMQ15435.1 50S ribosomal protein L35 [Phycisphaerae bacterium]